MESQSASDGGRRIPAARGLGQSRARLAGGNEAEEFREVFRGSPVRRAKLSGLRGNAVIAMGNSGDEKFVPTLKKLSEDSDPQIAEHARWALDRVKA